jgi:CRP-like cAMP-binding protein
MADQLGREYADGEVVIRQGEEGRCMFVIQEGSVEVARDGHRVGRLGAGDVFGEMAIFERESRSATVTAAGATRILTVDRRTFLRRVQEDPTLALNILQAMSARIRALNDELAAVRARLAEVEASG